MLGCDPGNQDLFWPAVALFVAGWLVFAWPWLSGHVVIPWDGSAEFLPQVQFLASSIAHGDWPFWAPGIFTGHPQIADPQSQIFSPPMLLLAALDPAPGNWAFDTTVLVCLLGAGLGVQWLFRENGWHPAGGMLAAFGFAFGAAMAWRLQHYGQLMSLAYLPFALLFLKRALDRSSIPYGLAAGAVSGLIVCGRDQVALLEIYVLAGFVIWWWVERSDALGETLRASIAPLAAGAVGGLAVALVPVVLTALFAGQSNRPEIDLVGAGRGSLHPALLLTALAPQLYGAAGGGEDWWGPPSATWQGTDLFTAQNVGECYIGALALVMLIWMTARGLLWAREIRFFTVVLAASLLYALGWYTPVFRAFYALMPGVTLYRRPADAVFLIGGFAAIVAGYGLHRYLMYPLHLRRLPLGPIEIGAVVVGFATAAAIAVAASRGAQGAAALGLAAACFAAGLAALAAADWLEPIRPVAAMALLAAAVAGDLAVNNGPNGASGLTLEQAQADVLEPTTRNETIALLRRKVSQSASATRRDRVVLAGLGFNWPNAALTHGLENVLGYNPLRLDVFARATGAEDHSALPDQLKFAPLFPSYSSRLADLMGLRWIASPVPIGEIDKRLPAGALALVARTSDAYVYENTSALPRVMFADRAVGADFDDMLETGIWPDVDPSSTVLLEAAPTWVRRPGTARLTRYRNTEVVIEADSPDGGFVVLNDVWQAWWRATVDGEPRPLHRANVLFRAVEVPAGHHVVRMTFQPITGAIDTLLGRH